MSFSRFLYDDRRTNSNSSSTALYRRAEIGQARCVTAQEGGLLATKHAYPTHTLSGTRGVGREQSVNSLAEGVLVRYLAASTPEPQR